MSRRPSSGHRVPHDELCPTHQRSEWRTGAPDRAAAHRSSTAAPRLALEVLKHEVLGAILPADVVDRADVRVREGRDGLGLPLEPLAELRIGGLRVGEDLDRDGAVQARVPRLVDFAHAAGAERGEDFVRAEARTNLANPGLEGSLMRRTQFSYQ